MEGLSLGCLAYLLKKAGQHSGSGCNLNRQAPRFAAMPYFKITQWSRGKAQKRRRNEVLLALPKIRLLFVCSVNAVETFQHPVGLPTEGHAHQAFQLVYNLIKKEIIQFSLVNYPVECLITARRLPL